MVQAKLIGFAHKAGVGKTTAANYLVEEFGAIKLSFADPLKDSCKTLFDWSDVHVRGSLKNVEDPRWGMTPGRAQQIVGTMFRQEFGEDFWVKNLLSRVEKADGIIVVDDVRYKSEAMAIKKLGLLVKINRTPNYIGRDPNHPSEIDLDCWTGWDSVIDNKDISIESFRLKIISEFNRLTLGIR